MNTVGFDQVIIDDFVDLLLETIEKVRENKVTAIQVVNT